jgi:DNA-binding transcriptional ArsR family regulator
MTLHERPVRRIDDPEVLKGLAHPLRQRLWRLLHQLGPCTVGTLANRVGADPGQVSYHLRELAKRGWIHPVPELARDRRESWWRVAPESTSWTIEDFPTPEGQALVRQLHAAMVVEDVQRLGRFVQTFQLWSGEWIGASVSARSFLFLTPRRGAGDDR